MGRSATTERCQRSDTETLWRARSGREKNNGRDGCGLFRRDTLEKCAGGCRGELLSFRKSESWTGSPAFSRAAARMGVISRQGVALIARQVMMNRVAVVLLACFIAIMHWARHDRGAGDAKRQEQSCQNVEARESPHRGVQSTGRGSGRNTGQQTRHHENEQTSTKLQGCRAAEPRRSRFAGQ